MNSTGVRNSTVASSRRSNCSLIQDIPGRILIPVKEQFHIEPTGEIPALIQYATLSPDGKQIAYLSDKNGNLEIYLMNADGTSKRRLTDHPGYDAQINWSPDGEKIVFMSDRDGNDIELYTITISTREIERLSFNDWGEGEPAWSSDGKKIAFLSGSTTTISNGLYIIYADETNINQIPPSKYGDYARPTWRPDDSCLVYEHVVHTMFYKISRLFIYDFETGIEKRLISRWPTNSNSPEWYASFTKYGQYLLFWLLDDENGLFVLDMK